MTNPEQQPRRQPGILQFASWGGTLAVCVGAGMVAGWFADRALSTLPVFLFVGLLAGVGTGAWYLRTEYKKYS